MSAPVASPWDALGITPRRWQAEFVPVAVDALRQGTKGIGCMVMGAGKTVATAAMVWTALQKARGRLVLVTVPSEDLVRQTAANLARLLPAGTVGVFYGKKKQPARPVVVCCNRSITAMLLATAELGRETCFILCDEVHKSEAEEMKIAIPQFRSPALLGLTATPYRSAPRQTIELFDRIIYEYPMREAIADGVLVDFRTVRVQGTELLPLDELCLSMIRAEGPDIGPGIISARSMRDAEAYAEWLTGQGFAALAIHSGHSEAERTRRLHMLRVGEVRALVHIHLLAEGVDFPWLRWLCMRSKISASVKFLQQLGRPLRALHDPDDIARWGPKTGAIMFDPCLNLGRFGLDNAAAVGLAMEQAAEAEAKEAGPRDHMEPTPEEAVALDLLLEHLDAVADQLLARKIIASKEIEGDQGWKLADVSQKQVDAIKDARRHTRHIPAEYREPIKAIARVPWALTRGQASVLLDVLFGGSKWAWAESKRRGVESYRVTWPSSAVVGVASIDPDEVKRIMLAGARMERAEAKLAGAGQ